MALENILATLRRRGAAAILHRRWLVTGLFGLVHGFGFSFVQARQQALDQGQIGGRAGLDPICVFEGRDVSAQRFPDS